MQSPKADVSATQPRNLLATAVPRSKQPTHDPHPHSLDPSHPANRTPLKKTHLTALPISTPRPPPTSLPSMTSPASKRLFKEYKSLSSDPPEGITAGPVSEDDMFIWEALIQGPEGTPFEGGVFPAELKFPKDYPLAPPKMKFLTDMWHPNGAFRCVSLCCAGAVCAA